MLWPQGQANSLTGHTLNICHETLPVCLISLFTFANIFTSFIPDSPSPRSRGLSFLDSLTNLPDIPLIILLPQNAAFLQEEEARTGQNDKTTAKTKQECQSLSGTTGSSYINQSTATRLPTMWIPWYYTDINAIKKLHWAWVYFRSWSGEIISWRREREIALNLWWRYVPSKQPIRAQYLGHVIGYQPIRDHCYCEREGGR